MDYSYDRRNALWYRQSARKWTEALPVGNGRIGAMLFGGVACERIALNEDSLWSGYPKDKNNPDAHKYYAQAQQLAQSGQLAQAQRLIEDRLEGAFTESYMPLGDIYIEFSGVDECRNYTHCSTCARDWTYASSTPPARTFAAPRSRRIPIRYSCCAARAPSRTHKLQAAL